MSEPENQRRRSSIRSFFSRKGSTDSSKSRNNSIASPTTVAQDGTSLAPIKSNVSSTSAGGGRRGSFKNGRKSSLTPADEQLYERDEHFEQTGERRDYTNMLHSLGGRDSAESLVKVVDPIAPEIPRPGSEVAHSLPIELWLRVLEDINPSDTANLAISCSAFYHLLGYDAWQALKIPDNHIHKLKFLVHMDSGLPKHLLCFACARYHVRTHSGRESLKPANVLNPIYNCPNADRVIPPRMRLTSNRNLPFTFVQLALRAHRYSPTHGITVESLSRRYKDRESTWSHTTRYTIINNHLLVRVISTCFAPPNLPPAAQRNLLYSRDDYVPYFSVCAHWRDGELMSSVKCALSHIPAPLAGEGINRVGREIHAHFHRPNKIVTLCQNCRVMRRCPECPTEYLIEVKIAEDPSDKQALFKQALVVTRWSDLGDGLVPWGEEWAACTGTNVVNPDKDAEDIAANFDVELVDPNARVAIPGQIVPVPVVSAREKQRQEQLQKSLLSVTRNTTIPGTRYDSFGKLGKRAISGVFEAKFNVDAVPGQKMVSMNPRGERRGEEGHNWY